MPSRRLLSACLAVAGLLATGCGALQVDTTTAAATADLDVEVHDTTVDGRVRTFGFVHAVDATGFPATVTFDEATWSTGAQAEAAARAAGHSSTDAPVGQLVVNPDPALQTLPMAGNVVITLVDDEGAQRVVSPQEWSRHVKVNADGEASFYEPYHAVVVDGTVVELTAQPLP
ncbi:hypothetical protein [Egicoccus sp. AB-alg2]|uniref:hypothetical protein n=1 Tax=Egicoccus sp. AB-alg2 TaxID=3242693 RepID=UPI00359E440F